MAEGGDREGAGVNVEKFLEDNKLMDVYPIFIERKINVEEFLEFDTTELNEFAKDLGLDVLQRKRFVKAIGDLVIMRSKAAAAKIETPGAAKIIPSAIVSSIPGAASISSLIGAVDFAPGASEASIGVSSLGGASVGASVDLAAQFSRQVSDKDGNQVQVFISPHENEVLDKLQTRYDNTLTLVQSLQSSFEVLDRNVNVCDNDIELEFQTLALQLQLFKKELMDEIDKVKDDKKSKLNEQMESLIDHRSDITAAKNRYQKLISNPNLDVHLRKKEVTGMVEDLMNSKGINLVMATQPKLELTWDEKYLSTFLTAIDLDDCDQPLPPMFIVRKTTYEFAQLWITLPRQDRDNPILQIAVEYAEVGRIKDIQQAVDALQGGPDMAIAAPVPESPVPKHKHKKSKKKSKRRRKHSSDSDSDSESKSDDSSDSDSSRSSDSDSDRSSGSDSNSSDSDSNSDSSDSDRRSKRRKRKKRHSSRDIRRRSVDNSSVAAQKSITPVMQIIPEPVPKKLFEDLPPEAAPNANLIAPMELDVDVRQLEALAPMIPQVSAEGAGGGRGAPVSLLERLKPVQAQKSDQSEISVEVAVAANGDDEVDMDIEEDIAQPAEGAGIAAPSDEKEEPAMAEPALAAPVMEIAAEEEEKDAVLIKPSGTPSAPAAVMEDEEDVKEQPSDEVDDPSLKLPTKEWDSNQSVVANLQLLAQGDEEKKVSRAEDVEAQEDANELRAKYANIQLAWVQGSTLDLTARQGQKAKLSPRLGKMGDDDEEIKENTYELRAHGFRDERIYLITVKSRNRSGWSLRAPLQEIFTQKLVIDSKILKPNEKEHLVRWLPRKHQKKKWKLIYRGSKHGFASGTFHMRCDQKSPTVSIIKSSFGNVFGGFTELGWGSGNAYRHDKHAYIFLLRSKKNRRNKPAKYPVTNVSNAVYHGNTYGPTFGSGFDFYLCDNCNSSSTSYANAGNSYACPRDQNLLAGAYNFTVKDYEVFQLRKSSK